MAATNIHVVEPNETSIAELRGIGVRAVNNITQLPTDLHPAVIMFAVKPQAMDIVAPSYARFATSDAVFLSIAAGKPIGYFEAILGDATAIVRTMPNTPAAVHRGITVACANSCVSKTQIAACTELLEAVGEIAWVDDEGLIDAVTALSGGGPAYVFLLAECLAQAGIEAGLPEELSHRLARVTVAGSGELLHRASETPVVLRQNVTSPGGTTAEALKILMADDGWQQLMNRAIAAATTRSRELAG